MSSSWRVPVGALKKKAFGDIFRSAGKKTHVKKTGNAKATLGRRLVNRRAKVVIVTALLLLNSEEL